MCAYLLVAVQLSAIGQIPKPEDMPKMKIGKFLKTRTEFEVSGGTVKMA